MLVGMSFLTSAFKGYILFLVKLFLSDELKQKSRPPLNTTDGLPLSRA